MSQQKNTNETDYHLSQLDTAFATFKKAYPTFEKTTILDDLRATDYHRLDELNHIYLDYTGGSLYADSQLQKHMDLLKGNVFGNPHSNNLTSVAMTNLVEQARAYILKFFNASPDDYVAIFTANASAALKHVGESYPFEPGGHYLATFDNHNSVNGIREFARSKGATTTYVPVAMPDLRLNTDELKQKLALANPNKANLFAYPAQSNSSGVQHPLELIEMAQAKGWDVLLDAAAFVPTNRLDLTQWQADFVALSFYKIFGYPTGIGCLLARKKALAKLVRPWFAGGTITLASVQGQKHYLAINEVAFEDGTVNYLNIPAIELGLKHINNIGLDIIHERVTCLTSWLLKNLLALQHNNGEPLVRVYGPTNTIMRGGTIALNLYDPNGILIDYHRVEELANEVKISLRTGCFCNPGVGEISEGITEQEINEGFEKAKGRALPYFLAFVESKSGKGAGSLRVSVGLATNFADVYKFINFIHGFLNQTTTRIGGPSFDIKSCRIIRDGS